MDDIVTSGFSNEHIAAGSRTVPALAASPVKIRFFAKCSNKRTQYEMDVILAAMAPKEAIRLQKESRGNTV